MGSAVRSAALASVGVALASLGAGRVVSAFVAVSIARSVGLASLAAVRAGGCLAAVRTRGCLAAVVVALASLGVPGVIISSIVAVSIVPIGRLASLARMRRCVVGSTALASVSGALAALGGVVSAVVPAIVSVGRLAPLGRVRRRIVAVSDGLAAVVSGLAALAVVSVSIVGAIGG